MDDYSQYAPRVDSSRPSPSIDLTN